MKTRFAITCMRKGNRVLAFRNVATSHYDTREEAESALSEFNTYSPAVMRDLFPHSRVDPVECYDHGEAVRTVF